MSGREPIEVGRGRRARRLSAGLGLAVALTACEQPAFPTLQGAEGAPDAVAAGGSEPAERGPPPGLADGSLVADFAGGDGAPDRSPAEDRALPAEPAEDQALPPEPVDWGVLPDAGPGDRGVASDEGLPRLQYLLRQVPEAGCAPRDVILSWGAQGATGCALTLLDGAQYPDLPAVGAIELRIEEETSLDLRCTGPGVVAQARVPVIFSPALAESLDLLRAPRRIRGAQQRCAGALGEYVMDNESEVREDDPSAARLCRCEGYVQRQIVEKSNRCFAVPHDKGIVRWWDNAWVRERASSHNKCITHLRCTRPVTTCAELLYPR